MRSHILCLFAALLLVSISSAQTCGSNGGSADLTSSPLALGKNVTVSFTGDPGSLAILFLSDGAGPTPVPPVGTACLTITSPVFDDLLTATFPPSGQIDFSFAVPNDPALLSLRLYLQGLAGDTGHASGLALTQGLRVEFENPDSYESLPSLASARALATATVGGDGRVVITGGGAGSLTAPTGTNAVEIYDPFDRSFSTGAPMSVVRALHTATKLQDGRILVTGGVANNVTSNATTGCEIFDPFTGAWTAAAAMSTARAGHAAELLDDGRVLVVGGTPSFGGGQVALGPVLNASHNTGEVYNPVTNSWSLISNTMSSKRLLPSATRMDNGRVLVVSGLNGATNVFGQDLPTWTSSVDFYDPTANAFVPAAGIGSANARAGASAVRMSNGDIVVAGGVSSGLLSIPTATNSVRIFRAGTWVAGPALPAAVALPGVAPMTDGSVLFVGGITGDLLAPGATGVVARFDGTAMTTAASLPAPRGAQMTASLGNGGVLVTGGADAAAAPQATSWFFTPNL